MKKLILGLCCILVVVLSKAQSKDEQLVQQTVRDAFSALSNKDSTGLKEQCTADVKFYEYGQVWTMDSLINLAIIKNTATDFKRTNKFDFVNTSISGNVAWTTYDLYSDITSNGKRITIHWLETQVLLKEKGKWKIKLLHSTLVKRE